MTTVPAAPFPELEDLPRRAKELLAGTGELLARTLAQVCGLDVDHALRLAALAHLKIRRQRGSGDLWVRLDGGENFAAMVARGRRVEAGRRAGETGATA